MKKKLKKIRFKFLKVRSTHLIQQIQGHETYISNFIGNFNKYYSVASIHSVPKSAHNDDTTKRTLLFSLPKLCPPSETYLNSLWGLNLKHKSTCFKLLPQIESSPDYWIS